MAVNKTKKKQMKEKKIEEKIPCQNISFFHLTWRFDFFALNDIFMYSASFIINPKP